MILRQALEAFFDSLANDCGGELGFHSLRMLGPVQNNHQSQPTEGDGVGDVSCGPLIKSYSLASYSVADYSAALPLILQTEWVPWTKGVLRLPVSQGQRTDGRAKT